MISLAIQGDGNTSWECLRCAICDKQHHDEETFIRCYRKNPNKVDWDFVSKYRPLSEDFIREFKDEVNWYSISAYQTLSEDFIREFKDEVNWYSISAYQSLSEDFIREFEDKVHWPLISESQPLSEEFIREFKDNIEWDCISEYQALSEDFIKEFKDRLDLDIIRKKKETHIPVESYAEKHGLTIENGFLYAFRNHDKWGKGYYSLTKRYQKGVYYRDWHCNVNPCNENSYGFGIWPKGNTPIRVKVKDWGTAVLNNLGGKARVWGFEII
jgi:hypothetical protein